MIALLVFTALACLTVAIAEVAAHLPPARHGMDWGWPWPRHRPYRPSGAGATGRPSPS